MPPAVRRAALVIGALVSIAVIVTIVDLHSAGSSSLLHELDQRSDALERAVLDSAILRHDRPGDHRADHRGASS